MSEPLIERLRKKVNYLSAQQPWNTVQGESIHIQDASEWDENKLSLSGNMKQEKRSGKNLYNLNDKKTVASEITTDADGWIKLNCDNSSGTSTRYINYFTNNLKLANNTQYNIFIEIKDLSYTASESGTVSTLNFVSTSGNSGQFSSNYGNYVNKFSAGKIYNNINTTKDTFDSVTDGLRTFATVRAGEKISATFRISVIEDTSVTVDNFEYEQYGAMPSTEFPSMPLVATGVQKIRQFGKNVCKITSVTGYTYTGGIPTAAGDITINKFDTNSLTITSVANSYRIALTNIIQLLPNTEYTLLYTRTNNLTGGSARRYIYDYSETGGYSLINSLNSGDDGKMSYTFTTGESGCIALAWGYNNTASGSSSVISDIQIEKGSVATEYESCNSEDTTLDLGTTELCKMTDSSGNLVAQDRPVYRNGKWQWEKNVKKLVLNGTENWKLIDNNSKFTIEITEKSNRVLILKTGSTHNLTPCFSNCFINTTQSIISDIENGIAFSQWSDSQFLYLSKFLDTIEELKTWLANKYAEGNPVVIYYPLETPTYTDCTSEQSEILDKLYNNFKLQKGVNNIIVETDNGVGVNMELTYMQDLQTKLNILEAMCVSNASQEV